MLLFKNPFSETAQMPQELEFWYLEWITLQICNFNVPKLTSFKKKILTRLPNTFPAKMVGIPFK